MRVLLTEGSGLTSRQVAGRLHAAGHDVGVLSSDPLGLTRFTRGVRRWHPVPTFGKDPLGWFDAAVAAYRTEGYELLFPTQEQVAVLAALATRLHDSGVVTPVPTFRALMAVQDKLAARTTLDRLGLGQPESVVLTSSDSLAAWDRFPVYLKSPIGTATSGVHRLETGADLTRLLRAGHLDDAFVDGGVLAQRPARGPLAMVQSVFDHGRLIAFHANLRTRLGVRGGASNKRSLHLPRAREMIETLGTALHWHGALSVDVIVTAEGPEIIDVNPRLVEPGNAHHSGVDLVGAMVDAALDASPEVQREGRPDVNTHQLLVAVLGAAEQGRGRHGIVGELVAGARHRDPYRDSVEELTPCRRDLRAVVPVAAAAATTVVAPTCWRWFASGSVANYALTSEAWRAIRERAERAAEQTTSLTDSG